jgi:hypothetical protein
MEQMSAKTVFDVNTRFGIHYVDANKWLATALECDGNDLLEALRKALVCAKLAEEAAYEHSVMEKIAAANLINTINTIKAVLTNG